MVVVMVPLFLQVVTGRNVATPTQPGSSYGYKGLADGILCILRDEGVQAGRESSCHSCIERFYCTWFARGLSNSWAELC